jgi:DNA-directed RNA polymerase specialized sigma24 family protein
VRQVARWAGRLGGPTLDVEDVVHEVFTIAHQRLPTFRGDSSVTEMNEGAAARCSCTICREWAISPGSPRGAQML